jgi:hypothetical protein
MGHAGGGGGEAVGDAVVVGVTVGLLPKDAVALPVVDVDRVGVSEGVTDGVATGLVVARAVLVAVREGVAVGEPVAVRVLEPVVVPLGVAVVEPLLEGLHKVEWIFEHARR